MATVTAQTTEGERENPAHSPDTHPPARQRARCGLSDARCGQDEPGRGVGPRDLFDVQQERERQHPEGESGNELCGDDSSDA